MLTATAGVLVCVPECVCVCLFAFPFILGSRLMLKMRLLLNAPIKELRRTKSREEEQRRPEVDQQRATTGDKKGGQDGGKEGRRGGGETGGQSNLLPRANDVLPSPGRERETEPLPLIDVKCVIFSLLIKAGWDERRGECGLERQTGSPTCLMGMARPLPMLSARPSRPFLSLSVSLAFLDCGKTTADNKSRGV